MNNLSEYIIEKLKIDKDINVNNDLEIEGDIDKDIEEIIISSIKRSGSEKCKGIISKNDNKISIIFDKVYSSKQIIWISNDIEKKLREKNISHEGLEFNRENNQITILVK